MSDLKPVPVPDERTEGFWRAAADGVLAIQRCDRCGHFEHPPVFVCARCHAPEAAFTFTPVSGRAVVRTWTVVHTSFLTAFAADVPYVLVEVELPEQTGLCYTARLVDGPTAGLRLGAPVEVVFEPLRDGFVLPQLRLVGETS
jgi:uncharacterized OB-fold protein